MDLGMNAKLYYHATEGTHLADMTAIVTSIANATLTLSAEEADTSTRGGAGWMTSVATLRSIELSFDMPLDSAEADIKALRLAYLTNGVGIAAAALSGAKTINGAWGIECDWDVYQFDRGEDLNDKQVITVRMKPKIKPTFIDIVIAE